MTVCLQYGWPSSAVVVVAFFSITGPSQTLIGQSTHFSLRLLLRDWRNPQQLKRFQRFNVPVDFFEFLSTEFAACSKTPSRDNHRKASYPKTQQRDH